MNESTHSTTGPSPFTKPGFIISAALVIAVIAAVIVIFFLPKGDGTAQPAPASSPQNASAAPTKSTDAAGKSICGLPSTSETALGTAPKSNWELVGTMAAPNDPKTGPGRVDDQGIRSCFAHSPQGALYAAVNLWALGSDPSKERAIADQLVAKGPGRDIAMAAKPSPASTAAGIKIQVAGFNVSYTSQQAVVQLAFRANTGALAAVRTTLVWQDGDWKGLVSDADGKPLEEPQQVSDLSRFIPWSGA
jgi:hypothetical protein